MIFVLAGPGANAGLFKEEVDLKEARAAQDPARIDAAENALRKAKKLKEQYEKTSKQ